VQAASDERNRLHGVAVFSSDVSFAGVAAKVHRMCKTASAAEFSSSCAGILTDPSSCAPIPTHPMNFHPATPGWKMHLMSGIVAAPGWKMHLMSGIVAALG
jgi:hypothetical protein